MLKNREFRPIPFRNLNDIKSTFKSIEDVIQDCLDSGHMLMQDSLDMKVEEFTTEELREIERKGVRYSCISSNLGFDDTFGDFVVLDEFLDVCADAETKYFLNNTLSVTCKPCEDDFSRYLNDVDIDDDSCEYEVYSLKVADNIKGGIFSFKLAYVAVDDDFTGLTDSTDMILLVNDKLVCHLDTDIISDSYFELVQICRSKVGFDLVLYFPESCIYCGLRLSKDLYLVSVVNFDCFVDTESIVKDYTDIFAKSKLLN